MKKKLFIIVISCLVFALLVISYLFFLDIKYFKYGSTQEQLKNYAHYLTKIELNNKIVETGYTIDSRKVNTIIFDKEGNNIYSNITSSKQNNLKILELLNDKNEVASVKYFEYFDGTYIYYILQNNRNVISVLLPNDTLNSFNNKCLVTILIIFFATLFITVILLYRFMKIALKPYDNLEKVSKNILSGDFIIRLSTKEYIDIEPIASAFNRILDNMRGKMDETVVEQNKLKFVLENMESGVVALNGEGEIVFINSFANDILFSKNENVIGKKLLECIKEPKFSEFYFDENINSTEMRLTLPYEKFVKLKKSKMPRMNSNIKMILTIQEITEIIRLENMRSQFIANVSHELKTPLTSIKGFTETLKYVEDQDTKNKFIEIIEKESDRLTRLINDILVLSKIESSTMEKEEEFLPGEIFDDVINMVKKKAEAKKVILEVNDTNTAYLTGSKDKFYQVVLNLVDNGIKYSKSNGYVKINSYNKESMYYLEVTDNGIGIPQKDIPHIFERFYRVDKSRKGEGTGLGLAIVKHIIINYNGDIKVKSKLGEGAKFIIKLKVI